LSATMKIPAQSKAAVRRQNTGLSPSKTAFHSEGTRQAKKRAAARPILSNSTGSHCCEVSIVSIIHLTKIRIEEILRRFLRSDYSYCSSHSAFALWPQRVTSTESCLG